ncbi:HopJ type III effector protein [Reinekea thalattae]|uniref:HopJ type III effector protein n=1 Tax=Reinekea thalattae TaxID=2593301 RepID=A0A5C8ZCC9_9GAMM|nr:HopJ type III effector protein [Reinekea thalattae]TXR54798.1 HopJ type III effector protein [Reinekea thalattae]
MTLNELLEAVYANRSDLKFDQVLACIDAEFEFTPCAFANGNLNNSAEQNQGSCKVLSFAFKAGLNESQALLLFAEHYQSVLADPEGDAHQNIRQFMNTGWKGVSFEKVALQKK